MIRSRFLRPLLPLFVSAAFLDASHLQGAPPQKQLPLPGEAFLVENRVAFVILPPESVRKKPQPWVWYAPTLNGLPSGAEQCMFERFTQAGIAIAGIDVGESYGSPEGRALFSALHAELTSSRGFSTRPVLLGRSRSGLMTLCWAAENAEKVGGFAGIYPVCNIASYPGIAKAAGTYKMPAEELTQKLPEHNPIDRLASLAAAKVPLFAIHGDEDKVVPLAANSREIHKRYQPLGGSMELVIPKGQGHNHWQGFFQCEELVQFVLRHAH
jgi:pimeloyl-ACP methyl ester carboxylesterase